MQLSDVDIKKGIELGDIIINDFDESRLQPASYDVLLGYEFMIFNSHKFEYIDPKKSVHEFMEKVTLKDKDEYFVIHPGQFVLGVTKDFFGCNEKYACQIMGKSSLARYGLIVHTTAGFIDPGNRLNATLEFVNTNTVPIRLYPEMKIAQIAFYELKTPAQNAYGSASLGSKYYKSTGVQASDMHKNFDNKEE
jgi:dCTP deaminase